jgi:serine/threonine protein kinase
MTQSRHPDEEQLAGFLTGTLGDDAQERVAAHIAACDRCCQALRGLPEDPFLAQLKEIGSALESGEARAFASGSRDLSAPAELQDHPRYKLGKFLGAGGMGLVYQAEHRLMDRLVALKILRRDLLRHPRVAQRFRQEFKAAAKLAHPNIVAVYDADQAGESHFLVMEFVDGVSLDRLVTRRGPLEPAYACHFIRQAAKGLEHAFGAGMVHRDIKPQNLMLTRKGQIKILDFGLARLASESRADLEDLASATPRGKHDSTHLGDIIGTPAYMAPEQASDASQADIRADIYSLGSTLYYLLTGQPPFGVGAPRAKLLAKAKADPVPIVKLRADLPAGLINVIEKMMAKDPANRYQTPAEVVTALAEFAKPASVSASAPKAKAKAKSAPPPPIGEPPILDLASNEPHKFLARCPFCLTRFRLPAKALGASLPCPQCSNFFTTVPEEDGAGH